MTRTAMMTLSALTILALCNAASADVYYNDGGQNTIDSYASGNVFVANATQVDLITGGTVGSVLSVMNNSHVNIAGGTVNSDLYAFDSTVEISSGTVNGNLHTNGDSEVTITGGIFPYGLYASDFSQIIIYGSDFKIAGNSVDYGEITAGWTDMADTLISPGLLTGTLANGDALLTVYQIHPNASIVLAPVPEPATIALLGLGCMVLARKRR